jgi:molybdopterin-guanine dinucleotide biosynthesis protein A
MTLKAGGIVLCGGQSRRMGRPKAWLPMGRELLLQRVVRIVREVAQPVVVVAAPRQDLPPLPSEVQVVHDKREGRGPLEGLAAGLRRIQDLGADAAYLSSTDVPFLSAGFVEKVLSLLGESWIAVPLVGEQHHPLAGVYRTACLAAIDRLLAADRLRPIFLFDQVPTRLIGADELTGVDPALDSVRNVNSPEDYQLALRDFAAGRD